MRKAVISFKESLAASSAQTTRIPSCNLHSTQAVFYCQKCVELICSKCLKAHSDHLDDIGPIDDATSASGNYVRSAVDKITSTIRKLKSGAQFWDFYADRLRVSEEAQTAKFDSLDKAILELRQKRDSLKAEIKSSYEKRSLEMRTYIAALFASQSNLEAALQKINSLPASSSASTFDWSLLNSQDLLAAHSVPTNFPDLSEVTVDTVNMAIIKEIHRLASLLVIEKDPLSEHPKMEHSFQVVFKQVSSITDYIESSVSVFDRIKVYERFFVVLPPRFHSSLTSKTNYCAQ